MARAEDKTQLFLEAADNKTMTGRMYILVGIVFWALVALAPVRGQAGTKLDCVVTNGQDLDANADNPFKQLAKGSLRDMLIHAMAGECKEPQITIDTAVIALNAPLGQGAITALKGFTIQPSPQHSRVKVHINYDSYPGAASCSADSPYADCVAYLPTSNVTIRNLDLVVSPTTQNPPLRGICVDRDNNAIVGNASANNITIDNCSFTGFQNGGVVVAPAVRAVKITQTVFHNSGTGLVLETGKYGVNEMTGNSGYGHVPLQSVPLGATPEDAFAQIDAAGKIVAYHLRGVTNIPITAVEIYKVEGKAGGEFVKACDVQANTTTKLWQVACVLPPTLPLDFNYAAMTIFNDAENKDGASSMFSLGVLTKDLKTVGEVPPLDKVPAVTPPSPKIENKNPPVYADPKIAKDPSTSLQFNSGASPAAGCSLIRH